MTLETEYAHLLKTNPKKRVLWLTGLFALIAYFVYIWFSFDVAGAFARANWERAGLLALDSYAYKYQADLKTDEQEPLLTIEGDKRNPLTDAQADWYRAGDELPHRIDFVTGGYFTEFSTNRLELWQGDELKLDVNITAEGPRILNGADDEWLKIADNKIEARPNKMVRIVITAKKITVQRYAYGWENFWFDTNSPLFGYSIWGALGLIGQERIDPERSNLGLIWHEFLDNDEWLHKDVFEALGITLIMAFCGVLLAMITALPLAFMAAKNVTPSKAVRLGTKRGFDFLRAVDHLIWSLIFIRAFGLGPLSGVFAIWFTETGTLGKLFSEAIENADRKQVEGMASTGANQVTKNWFGFLPQIAPVFISQTLYFLESSTRSATVIGMLGAGGIGLKLAETIRTGSDWENTVYLIVLIIGLVIIMDNISGWLRTKLIKGAH